MCSMCVYQTGLWGDRGWGCPGWLYAAEDIWGRAEKASA
jgi:hypothetical protein